MNSIVKPMLIDKYSLLSLFLVFGQNCSRSSLANSTKRSNGKWVDDLTQEVLNIRVPGYQNMVSRLAKMLGLSELLRLEPKVYTRETMKFGSWAG